MPGVEHDIANHCFVVTIDENGQLTRALLEYELFDIGANGHPARMVNFRRTFVPTAFRGQGIAEQLVREGLRWAREENLRISSSCWYVDKFLR